MLPIVPPVPVPLVGGASAYRRKTGREQIGGGQWGASAHPRGISIPSPITPHECSGRIEGGRKDERRHRGAANSPKINRGSLSPRFPRAAFPCRILGRDLARHFRFPGTEERGRGAGAGNNGTIPGQSRIPKSDHKQRAPLPRSKHSPPPSPRSSVLILPASPPPSNPDGPFALAVSRGFPDYGRRASSPARNRENQNLTANEPTVNGRSCLFDAMN